MYYLVLFLIVLPTVVNFSYRMIHYDVTNKRLVNHNALTFSALLFVFLAFAGSTVYIASHSHYPFLVILALPLYLLVNYTILNWISNNYYQNRSLPQFDFKKLFGWFLLFCVMIGMPYMVKEIFVIFK